MLKVFISHAHEEKDIALAWQTLLETISQGAIEVWLSSDTKPLGGLGLGKEWRENIYQKLNESNFVIAILSPRSMEKPWILWETGVASGIEKNRGLIPILYSMPLTDFEGPLASYQAYSGEDKSKIYEICERLMHEAELKPKAKYWEPIVENYMNTIKFHRPARNAGIPAVNVWIRRIESLINYGRSSELESTRDAMYTSLGTDKPVSVEIHELLSQIFIEEKKFNIGLDEVKKALEILPDDLDLLHRKVLALLELEKYEEVKDNLSYINSNFPEAKYLPEIAGLEGRYYRSLFERNGEKECLKLAIDAYKQAYKKDNYSYYCGVNAVTLMLLNEQINDAVNLSKEVLSVCKKIENNNKKTFWLDFTIGDLELISGNIKTAKESYVNGLKRIPKPSDRQKESAVRGVNRIAKAMNLEDELIIDLKKLLLE